MICTPPPLPPADPLPVAEGAGSYVYPSRRSLAPRTRVVLNFVVEQSREIQALLAAGKDVVLI